MSYNLFLDDVREVKDAFIYPRRDSNNILDSGRSLEALSGIPRGDWHIVRSYESFRKCIERSGVPAVVSFDHDLSEEHTLHYMNHTRSSGIVEYGNLKEKTGLHCAIHLIGLCCFYQLKFPKYFIHSANHVGVANIKAVIEQFNNKKA